LPVHYWFIRHLYNPLLKKGYSKSAANLTVFLISAVAHEYLVSVPLGVISFYAFLAMILQSPIIYLEKKLNKALKIDTSQLGNVSFWISYCILGQPICVSIYYYLYVTKGTRWLSLYYQYLYYHNLRDEGKTAQCTLLPIDHRKPVRTIAISHQSRQLSGSQDWFVNGSYLHVLHHW
jgi:hypothetical protein